ncbi:hypothetical protein PQR34_46510 [Paraburkholderia sediminicola]|uniref:hypothetical protein n=1 Tax=Paraburkholderia sediminicola TaxID=458836 RepID=UPI0038BD07AE
MIEAAIECEDDRRVQRDQSKRQRVLIAKLASVLPEVTSLLQELTEMQESGAPLALPEELDDAAALVEEAGRMAGYVPLGAVTPYSAESLMGLTTLDLVEALTHTVGKHAHELTTKQSDFFLRRIDRDVLGSQKHSSLRSYVIQFDRAMASQKAEFRSLTGLPPLQVARVPNELVARQYLVATGRAPSNPEHPDDDIADLLRSVNTHRLSNSVFC